MIDAFLYLPDYSIGHMIAFQVERQMEKAGAIGPEFERMAKLGNIAPDLWMTAGHGRARRPRGASRRDGESPFDDPLSATSELSAPYSSRHENDFLDGDLRGAPRGFCFLVRVHDEDAAKEVLPFIADDYPKALALARAEKKPIFLETWAPW